MTHSDDPPTAMRWLGGFAAFVVSWRLFSVVFPHAATHEPLPLRVALTGLGLWFAACGLWAYRRSGGRAGFLFALYALATGLHWGGSVGLGVPRADAVLLIVYVVGSGVLAQALFVHLALAFPAPFRFASRRGFLIALHLPAAASGLLLLTPVLVDPGESGPVLDLLPLAISIGTLLGLAGLGVWVVRLVTSPPGERPIRTAVALLIAVTMTVVTMTGRIEAGLSGWLDLGFALLPAAIAADLVEIRLGNRDR